SAQDRPPYLDELAESADLRYTDAAGLPEVLPGADVLLLCDFFSTALSDAWEHADSLRWIHVVAAGVDTLLFDDPATSHVVVTNARVVFHRPTAEYGLAMIRARATHLHEVYDRQREHRWQQQETRTVQHDNALVVSTGAIGREIARLLSAVGIRVRGA